MLKNNLLRVSCFYFAAGRFPSAGCSGIDFPSPLGDILGTQLHVNVATSWLVCHQLVIISIHSEW